MGGNDVIRAGGGDNLVCGGLGKDVIQAGDGDDAVLAGSGNEDASGGRGDDFVALAQGDDTGHGGSGGDLTIGGLGVDNVNGQSGNDIVFGGPGDDHVLGGPGDDLLGGDIPPGPPGPPLAPGTDRCVGAAGNAAPPTARACRGWRTPTPSRPPSAPREVVQTRLAGRLGITPWRPAAWPGQAALPCSPPGPG